MLLGLAIAMMPLAGQAAPPLDWLVGEWCTDPRPNGKRTCERWTAMADGAMQGVSEVRAGDVATPAETMRIVIGVHGPVFHAEPRGQAPADFPAIKAEAQAITFEDRTHDYPQRVRYWREGEALMAEISLADGSKPMRWTFRRVAR